MDRIRLETKHVSIEFPGVKALDDINFEVSTGEIRAVVGANGAGKSTLMKSAGRGKLHVFRRSFAEWKKRWR